MTKATKDNDKSISTNIVAVTFDNELGSEKVSEERVWKSLGYFDAGKSDYSMEKINFPDNTLLYINQAFLTVFLTDILLRLLRFRPNSRSLRIFPLTP